METKQICNLGSDVLLIFRALSKFLKGRTCFLCLLGNQGLCASVKCWLRNCFTRWSIWGGVPFLHENDVLKASPLLKFWDYKILHHIKISLPCDGIDLGAFSSYLFKKIRSNDKVGHKTISYCKFFPDARVVIG